MPETDPIGTDVYNSVSALYHAGWIGRCDKRMFIKVYPL